MNHLACISLLVLITSVAVPREGRAENAMAPNASPTTTVEAPKAGEGTLGGLASYSTGPSTELHSEGMTIAGTVLTSIGVIGGVAGVVSLAALDGASAAYAGMFILAPAGTFLAVGIPILAVGAHEVPREPSDVASDALSVYLQVRPGGVALVGSF